MSRSNKAVAVLCVLLAAGTLAGCSPPPGYRHDSADVFPWSKLWAPGMEHSQYPHVRAQIQEGSWKPDTGYAWVTPGQLGPVKWMPGYGREDRPHVRSSTAEGQWEPMPGYEWLPGQEADLQVKWTPGMRNADHAHIYSADQQNEWFADPGYNWVAINQNLDVAWAPFQQYPDHPHVVAWTEEGYWMAAPGYEFSSSGKEIEHAGQDLEVVWNVGVTHPSCQWLRAASDEGMWTIDSNFYFENKDPHNLVFRRTSQSAQDQRTGRVLFDIFGAIVAHAVSRPSDNDNGFTSVAKKGAEEVRNEAVIDAVKTAASDPDADEHKCDLSSTIWTRGLTQ